MTIDAEEEDPKSRSQLKREFQELKDLVQQLVELSPKRVRQSNLSERIREAVLTAQELTRSPLNRQMRFIAGQLQDEDIDAIRSLLSGESQQRPEDVADVPESQRWGDELIAGDDQALSLFVDQHPGVDLQHLRQLVRNAKKERKKNKPAKSTQQLFEYLESLNSEVG